MASFKSSGSTNFLKQNLFVYNQFRPFSKKISKKYHNLSNVTLLYIKGKPKKVNIESFFFSIMDKLFFFASESS